ncbi:TIGR02302 family protein [Thiosulfatihalobacter marinus]|uniref:TIGR02302 family protein n=1 Tax=Thiosulfatihalobacter marinus TaxID=2792481 RepID=UPI0018D7FF3B
MAHRNEADNALKRLGWVLGLTRLGLIAEQVTQAFWPLWSLVFTVLAGLMLGVQDVLPLEAVWVLGVIVVAGGLAALVTGMRRFALPGRNEALARLDATLPGRPIQALMDYPVIGTNDSGSQALWRAHQARMAARTRAARPVEPDLRISRLDPFGLRYVAVLALAVALLFGSFARVGSVAGMAPGSGAALAGGPTWEGWIEPPAYTGLPALYLNDQTDRAMSLPEGSRVLVRLYGEVGALTLAETVSGRMGEVPSATEPEQDFTIRQSGKLEIAGPNGRAWEIVMTPDRAPQVRLTGSADVSARGEMSLPFAASDDFGVTGGQAVISLDLEAVDRRYGLARAPEPRPDVKVELPLPITGDRADFEETLIEDFSKHPWAHLPVTVSLTVQDAAGLTGSAPDAAMALPARRFFDLLAAVIVELRRDLLWSRENAGRVAQLMRAVSYRPEEGVFQKETDYLRLRTILRRLEAFDARGLSAGNRDEIAEALWDLALKLEEGDLGNALERLRRAQERLSEAMKNGASDAEIAQLMQELREATEDYMRELAQRSPQEGEEGADQQLSENTMQLNQDDLQRMMDRIQELMEQGRMAEAQQALDELRQMMENMRVTQGQGQPSPGEQAMEGLAETLREQQGLSDEAFRELQEQFNPGAQSGQSSENEGYSGGEGRGEAHDGTGQGRGQGEEGQQPGKGALEDRQRALREELNRQMGNLPGQGTPEGDAAREALGQADEAMEGAEDALRGDDLAEAIDRQAEAMDALREGMRSLGEAMAQQEQSGQQGTAENQGNAQDPLGRSAGNRGPAGTEEGLLQGEDVYRQARRLLDEIRRRAGEIDRPELERNYLERLLDRF